jgi:hypothetical protein
MNTELIDLQYASECRGGEGSEEEKEEEHDVAVHVQVEQSINPWKTGNIKK